MSAARVLFEGQGLLVVDKPAGVTVIPGRDEAAGPSLRESLERERGEKLWVVHRLDRDTSGVLVFALDADVHRRLSMAFENGEVKKRYLALVEGRFERAARVEVALVAARRGRMRPAGEGEEGKASTTDFEPLEAFDRGSLVAALPLTGRTHQIRVHLRSLGHPLLFDHQYGRKVPLKAADLGDAGEAILLARTPLHAAGLVLPALAGVSTREFSADLPEDMNRTLEALRR